MELWHNPEGFPKNAATQQMGIFGCIWVWFVFLILRFYLLVSHLTVLAFAAHSNRNQRLPFITYRNFFNITETMWPNF